MPDSIPETPDKVTEPRREPQAPWPYFTQRVAAKRLGVAVGLLHGLANNPGLRAVKISGSTGQAIYLFNREDIDAMAARIGTTPATEGGE